MRKLPLILALMALCFTSESATPCNSKFCVCRYDTESDQDSIIKTVDCSYDPKVLDRGYTLPNAVFTFDLSRNNLTIIKTTQLLQSETLKELILSDNRITNIQPLSLPQLKRLDLSNNKLEVLPKETFKNIRQLEYLNLANNKFTSFENMSFHHLDDLEEIILDNNILGPSLINRNLFDRSGYGLTHKIASVSISGIHLNFVHDNFFLDAYNLKKLVISNNNISDIFELPFTLEYLDLSDNPIEEISGEDFADLVALKELKLNNLWIKEIEGYTFSYLRSLVSLELERNANLTKFSVMAFGQDVLEDADDFPLERLSLKSSKLRTLDEKLMLPLGQLVHLDLQGNLWRCDCHLSWIKQLQIKPKYNEHLRCYTPKPLYNTKIFELDEKYFVCGVKDRRVGIAIAVVSSCIILTALGFWFFTIPRYKCCFLSTTNMPTAEYTVLPVLTYNRE